MVAALLLAIAVLLIAVAIMAKHIVRFRSRRKQRGLFGSWPVRKINVDELDSVFAVGPFGPSLETEVRFIGRGNLSVVGGTNDFEAWILSVLAKKSQRMFEFGTCTGKTTYLLARNASENAEIVTLTLAPDDEGAYMTESGDDPEAGREARKLSAFTEFLYNGTPVEGKVRQLFGDSKAFDETPYLESFDLIFIDGSHAYSYVRNDTKKALRMLKPGGVLLWHDYRGPRAKGIWKYLNELSNRLPLVHIAGTSLVVYRRPAVD